MGLWGGVAQAGCVAPGRWGDSYVAGVACTKQVRGRRSLEDDMTSIILGGLEKVLRINHSPMIMPTMRQIREGEEFSELTHSLSGVGVVLRVCILDAMRRGVVSRRSLGELAGDLMEDGSAVDSLSERE